MISSLSSVRIPVISVMRSLGTEEEEYKCVIVIVMI